MHTFSRRAVLNLQRRLYDLWTVRLMEAVELSEQAGPSDQLRVVLAKVEAAAAGIRAAIDVGAECTPDRTGLTRRHER